MAAERRRLSREIHDVVAHSMSVMVLQAAGARRVLGHDPDRAAEAMAQIEQVGRQSMAELGRLLAVLRASGLVDADDAAAVRWGPQPGLADLDALLDAFRADGLAVRAESAGRPGRLDGSVDLSALRIVTEALRNVARHAGGTAMAVVRLTWTPDQLVVEVTDDGEAPVTGAAPGTAAREPGRDGSGLLRMRERARWVGGRLDWGPLPGGGFRVAATLPTGRGGRSA